MDTHRQAASPKTNGKNIPDRTEKKERGRKKKELNVKPALIVSILES